MILLLALLIQFPPRRIFVIVNRECWISFGDSGKKKRKLNTSPSPSLPVREQPIFLSPNLVGIIQTPGLLRDRAETLGQSHAGESSNFHLYYLSPAVLVSFVIQFTLDNFYQSSNLFVIVIFLSSIHLFSSANSSALAKPAAPSKPRALYPKCSIVPPSPWHMTHRVSISLYFTLIYQSSILLLQPPKTGSLTIYHNNVLSLFLVSIPL